MIRLITRTLVILVATVSFALAQDGDSLEDQMNAQLSAQGLDPAIATDEQKAAALDTVLEAALAAELGGDVAGATDDEIAAAVATLVARNPTLADNTVGALAAAAARMKPSAAEAIAGQAAVARPSAAGAVVFAVGRVVTAGMTDRATTTNTLAPIAVAVTTALRNAGALTTDLVGQIGAATKTVFQERTGSNAIYGNVYNQIANAAGLNIMTVLNSMMSVLGTTSFEVDYGNLGNEFFEEDTLIQEENPSQDASPT